MKMRITRKLQIKRLTLKQIFQHIDFKNLSHATIHFELEDTNYLKDNILKFGLYR